MKLMVIDGNSIVNRAFYGVSQNLTTQEGLPTNAIFGFLNILFKLLDEEQPQGLAVAFDMRAPTFRHKAFAEYKAQRKEPLREVLSSWIQIQNLPHLQDGANHNLQVKISEIATALEDDYEVCFELIMTSTLTDSARHDLEVFQKNLSDNEAISANIIVVDNETLKFKYDEALNRNRPYINHEFNLEVGKYMELTVDETKAVIVALPLRDCIKIPGIK